MIKLKTLDEINIMREGGKRHAEILRELAKLCVHGESTMILEEEALRMIKEGGDKPAFLGYTPEGANRPYPAALCVSINDEIVHGIPNEASRIMLDGDIVSLDLGLIHGGLITDSAITVGVGRIDDEARELLNITKRALEAGVAEAINGNTVGNIGEAITDVVETTNFVLAEDLAGHGVGYKVHEDPFVPNFGIAGDGEKLVPGMVIAIEPMVNVGTGKIKLAKDGYTIKTRDGKRSAHFEHTIAITENGHIVLTL
jgi:methionyl aminopeptidase